MGAGITGLVTALLLQREGLGVTVIDQHRVGAGVTGYTTGKLSSLHQLVYSELSDTSGSTARAPTPRPTRPGWRASRT